MKLFAQRLPLAMLLATAAQPAFAQAIGGITTTGNSDPVTVGTAILTLLFAVGGIICVAAWWKVAATMLGGHHVETRVLWATGAGTVLLASCAFITARVLGGGGLGISL